MTILTRLLKRFKKPVANPEHDKWLDLVKLTLESFPYEEVMYSQSYSVIGMLFPPKKRKWWKFWWR